MLLEQRKAELSIDKPMSFPPSGRVQLIELIALHILFAFSIVPLIMHSIMLPAH